MRWVREVNRGQVRAGLPTVGALGSLRAGWLCCTVASAFMVESPLEGVFVCEVEEQNRELEDSKGSEHCGEAVHMEDEPLTSSRDGPSTLPTIRGANVSSPTVTPQDVKLRRWLSQSDCFPSW